MLQLNGIEITPTIFPDSTSQVWKLDEANIKPVNRVEWDYKSDAELVQLAQLKHLLDSYNTYTCLAIPYLPYGRQDKSISNVTTFGLYTFASLLNSMKFSRVDILDPHSKLALELLDNSREISPLPYINDAIHDCNPDTILYPDIGAQERYLSLIPYKTSIVGRKVRNPLTGEIVEYKLGIGMLDMDITGRRILIVDDICDGGATFVLAAKCAMGVCKASEVNLYTTHGIYSRGIEYLTNNGISRIYNRKGRVI